MGTQVADNNSNPTGEVKGEPQECFVLKWSDYHTNVADSLKLMRADGDFLDTTVACSGSEQLQAHRVVLSAFSPYLKGMLRNNPQPNPVLIMPPNVRFVDLHSLLEFMYHGEVRVPADNLESLMQLAQLLKVKGLTEEEDYSYKNEEYQVGSYDSASQQAKKRKRMTSTGSETNEDDSQFLSSSYNNLHPGGPNAGDEAGAGIKLSGLICPQCRVLIRGPAALKEHMAAAHGILGDQSPTQTPTKASNVPVGQPSISNAPKREVGEVSQSETIRNKKFNKKMINPEEDLEDEDLEEGLESSRMPASPYRDTNMSAPAQRGNLNATPTQPNKRTGRGGSSRGRSPALGRMNNPKERAMMGNMQGKKMGTDTSDRMEGRRASNNTGDYIDPSESRIGQVSPAPRSNSNNNNPGVSKAQKRPSNTGRTKADPSKSYYNM